MDTETIDIKDMHWLMDMMQGIDVGLIVLDRDFRIQVWNSFMENHSGQRVSRLKDKIIFDAFPDISTEWLTRKVDAVLLLKSRAFSTWEQRPYLLKFKNKRPITGSAEFMYQNITFSPLISAGGEIEHVCISIYDVTDVAINKMNLLSANKDLQSLSRIDQLTQLNNRGYWEECLSNEFMRVRRTKQKSTLLIFDIDHFKLVNDTYGHQAGDEVIRVTSQITRETIRQTDIAGRYGGEEFVVILIDTSVEDSMILAERLRDLIQSHPVTYGDTVIDYTISIGIAEFTDTMVDYSNWVENADQALYQAKESGRNKSVMFQSVNTKTKSA